MTATSASREQGADGRRYIGTSVGGARDTGQRARTRTGRRTGQQVQAVTGETVSIAFVDQGYTGQDPAQAARAQGIDLHVVKLPEAKKALFPLPRRWVVERSFDWFNRFRHLNRDYERLPETLAGLRLV